MNVLIVAATEAEIAPALNHFSDKGFKYHTLRSASYKTLEIDVLITGVGMTATTYQLTKALQKQKYYLAINVGIAGAFDRELTLGTVVNVVSEGLPELGVQDGDDFLSIFSLNLLGENEFPFDNKVLKNTISNKFNSLQSLKKVHGITVNTIHGEEKSITTLKKRIIADTESMEGGAFAYVCLQEEQPYIQLRSISNYVEKRNRANWQINTAIENLNKTLLELLSELTTINE